MEIIDYYESLLKLYVNTNDSLKGLSPGSIEEIQFANGLLKKLSDHAFSILLLARESRIALDSEISFVQPLSASAIVVTRAMIETYSVLYHTVLHPQITHRELMQIYYKKEGLGWRGKIGAFRDGQFEKQKEEGRRVKELQARLDVLRASYGQELPDTTIKQLKLTDFGEETASQTYNYFSWYAHGGYISVIQAGQANESDRKEYINLCLRHAYTVLSLTLIGIGKRFPHTRDIITRHYANVCLILKGCSYANHLDCGERKGLFQDIKTKKYYVWKCIWNPATGIVESSENLLSQPLLDREDAIRELVKLKGVESLLEDNDLPENLQQEISWNT